MTSNSYKGPQPRRYSNQDLYPTRWDPRCSSQFPLGNFWPVYLGNFWCEVYSQHATKVQEYFASKGLLVRMVFGRSEKNDPHFHFQKKANLYDFLVYFVRLEDAQDAVSYCHREKYYGHRLNVFPGREPSYFDNDRSVKHTILQPAFLYLTPEIYASYILDQSSVQVECIVQHQRKILLVQYASKKDRNKAILNCKICLPKPMAAFQPMQRFLEYTVEQEIFEWLRKDPLCFNILPVDINPGSYLRIPRPFNCEWQTCSKLRLPKQLRLFGSRKERWALHRVAFSSAQRKFHVVCTCPDHLWHKQKQRKSQPSDAAGKPKVQDQTIHPGGPSETKPGGHFYLDSQDVDLGIGIEF